MMVEGTGMFSKWEFDWSATISSTISLPLYFDIVYQCFRLDACQT